MKTFFSLLSTWLSWNFIGWYDLFPKDTAIWPTTISFIAFFATSIVLVGFFCAIDSVCQFIDKANNESRK